MSNLVFSLCEKLWFVLWKSLNLKDSLYSAPSGQFKKQLVNFIDLTFSLLLAETVMNVDHEIELLKETIKRLGEDCGDGSWKVKFGVLFHGNYNIFLVCFNKLYN